MSLFQSTAPLPAPSLRLPGLLALLIWGALPCPAQELSQYMPKAQMGTAMLPAEQKAELEWRREAEGMTRIQALGLYAVVQRAPSGVCELANGSETWRLERGEAFPFLGYSSHMARLRVADTFLEVPRDAVALYRVSEHPELVESYEALRATFLAARERALSEEAQARAQADAARAGRPTQYNGRPLPRNWIDPRQADANFHQQQQNAELGRIRRELENLNSKIQR